MNEPTPEQEAEELKRMAVENVDVSKLPEGVRKSAAKLLELWKARWKDADAETNHRRRMEWVMFAAAAYSSDRGCRPAERAEAAAEDADALQAIADKRFGVA